MLPSRLVKEAYCSIEKRCKLDEHTAELETEHAHHIIILSHLSLRIGDERTGRRPIEVCAAVYLRRTGTGTYVYK